MKTRNSKSSGIVTLTVIVIIFLASGIFLSCKKNATGATSSSNNMDDVAKILKGKKISGILTSSIDEESIHKFEAIKSLLTVNYESSIVFGVTIVNSEKS
jgi:cell division protein YceG involved in septum cleavage